MKSNSWTSAFETGVLALDVDLRMLFKIIDQIRFATSVEPTTGVNSLLLTLLSATIAHFDREQRLMVECKYDYRRAAQHEAEHEILASELLHLIDAYEDGKTDPAQVSQFMEQWLQPHCKSQDVPLGAAILNQKDTIDRRLTPETDSQNGIEVPNLRRMGHLDPIVWSHKIEVGIEIIDCDHKNLIDCFNEILSARGTASKLEVATLLEKLGNATEVHFSNEEDLMLARGFEDIVQHKEEHRRLLDEYGHQVEDWRFNRTSTDTICRFLYSWLLRHIVAMDLPLGEAIRAQDALRPTKSS